MSSDIREPILLKKLRLALSHLYALHASGHDPNTAVNQREAHQYLIEFQSRNIRRKVSSLHQRKRDCKESDSELSSTLEINAETNGSSIYAVLPFLLYTTTSHETEKLFCAQSILHRLRRMKTSEAIDYEMEFHDSPLNVNVLAQMILYRNVDIDPMQYWMEFLKFHGEQLSSFHTNLLGKVLNKYFQNWKHSRQNMSASDLEERIKGEMMLLILATVAYLNVYAHSCAVATSLDENKVGNGQIGPLLNSLSSSMAVVALRLRYTSASVASQSNINFASETPIVASIVHAFQTVSEFASSQRHNELLPSAGIISDLNESTSHLLCEQNKFLHQKTLNQCLCVALASIPDSLLGSPGGARGRLSIDPKCVMAANSEFRNDATGVGLLKEIIVRLIDSARSLASERNTDHAMISYVHQQILITGERWARFVPLPLDFVQYTLSSTMINLSNGSTSLNFHATFCAFLVRIYEGACMSVDQVLASSAGLTAEASSAGHQLGRKKQSSKSKKRHQERLQEVVHGDDLKRKDAESEVHLRGVVACHTAMLTWDCINALFVDNLAAMASSPNAIVEGEGPVGCMCTCVSACLPHFIRHGPLSDDVSRSTALFSVVAGALRNICSNENRSVRALAFEHITVVHKVLTENSKSADLTDFEMMIIQNICECSIILSEKCAYPCGYFENLAANNVEDLEVERNDVRDLLRAVCGFDHAETYISLTILDRIVQYFHESLSSHSSQSGLPSETIIHGLSAVAKPLQRLAKMIDDGLAKIPHAEKIFTSSLDIIKLFSEKFLFAISSGSHITNVLPIGRLICITLASFAPFFGKMVRSTHILPENLTTKLQEAVGYSILAVAASIKTIPELCAVSTLENTRYDIRGTMRPPGGEDHCGCIAFTRILKEGGCLGQMCLEYAAQASNSNVTSVYAELANIYVDLHRSETERPPGQIYGQGVAPKSRRMYLTALSNIGLNVMHAHPLTTELISSELRALIQKPIDVITSCNQRSDLADAEKMFMLCEASFDLAAFPSDFCKELFAAESFGIQATEILVGACVSVYDRKSTEEPSELIVQWGRLRGSVASLLLSCADPGLSELASSAAKALINAECNAIIHHCRQDSNVPSSIFHEFVISEDSAPAGIFIYTVRQILENLRKTKLKKSILHGALSSCLSVLLGSKDSVFSALGSHTVSELNEWEDPRPTLLEAWLLAVNEMIKICFELDCHDNQQLKQLGSETLVICVHILFSKQVEKEKALPDMMKCVSLDGPQTLAMVEFFEEVLKFGKPMFSEIGIILGDRMQLEGLGGNSDVSLIGGGIIVASIYRSASGSVPPWAIEYVPAIFKSLFNACGDTQLFLAIIFAGADLKLQNGVTYGAISSGKLAGRYYDTLKQKARDDFMKKATLICACNDNTKWRKLKILVKAICGGKKKASDFNLKPQFTNWECDRI